MAKSRSWTVEDELMSQTDSKAQGLHLIYDSAGSQII